MTAQTKSRSRARRPRFCPRLERLEDRWCPSCTVFQEGSTLSILGDRDANSFDITYHGEREVSVACDGGRAHTLTGIDQVLLDTGGGDDRVMLTFQKAHDDPFFFRADLGTGNDTFEATLLPAVQSSASGGEVRLEVLGQQGNDRLSLLLAGAPEAPQPHMFPAPLAVNFEGGQGDDNAIIAILNVAVTERMSLNFFGGAGNDQASINFREVAAHAPLLVNAFGGFGDDVASLNFTNVAINADLAVNVQGAQGDDNAIIAILNVAVNADVAVNVDSGGGADEVGVIIVGSRVASDAVLTTSVNTGPGDDVMVQEVSEFQGSYSLAVNTGPGDDVMINDELDFQGSYSLVADFGLGDDVMVQEVSEFQGSLAMVVSMGFGDDVMVQEVTEFQGSLNVTVDGEGGDDDIRLIYGFNPQPDPPGEPFRFSLIVDGGGGNDVIRGELRFDPESRGLIDVIFEGNAGDDDLTLLVDGLGGPDTFQALLDGGEGHDIARVTAGLANLLVRNVEEVFFIER